MQLTDLFKDFKIDELNEEIRKKITYCWGSCITLSDIDEWLQNFTGKAYDVDIEKKLALMLLNNFIYVKHDEALHLCRVIYYEYIHKIALNNEDINDVLKKTKFYPIGNPSESSSLIMYFFRLANDIPKDRFGYSPSTPNENNRVVFIDDISGSGHQASDHIIDLFSGTIEKKYIDYLCLISTEKAVEEFKKIGINLISSCNLDSRMQLFSNESYTTFSDEMSQIIKNFLAAYQHEVNWNPLGYNETEIALGFYYNVPDNCIPIFWSEFNNWKALFKRFHKKYSTNMIGEVFDDRDQFI